MASSALWELKSPKDWNASQLLHMRRFLMMTETSCCCFVLSLYSRSERKQKKIIKFSRLFVLLKTQNMLPADLYFMISKSQICKWPGFCSCSIGPGRIHIQTMRECEREGVGTTNMDRALNKYSHSMHNSWVQAKKAQTALWSPQIFTVRSQRSCWNEKCHCSLCSVCLAVSLQSRCQRN